MNLALLDPFRRQIPDRIDSTLTLPQRYHPRASSPSSPNTNTNTNTSTLEVISDPEDNDISADEHNDVSSSPTKISTTLTSTSSSNSNEHPPACQVVSFNRRGTYLASGHASGAIPIHEFASRTLSSIHQMVPHYVPVVETKEEDKEDEKEEEKEHQEKKTLAPSSSRQLSNPHGCTSLTWSKRSRQVLSASHGDCHVCLFDNAHPLGPMEVNGRNGRKPTPGRNFSSGGGDNKGGGGSRSLTPTPEEMATAAIVEEEPQQKRDTTITANNTLSGGVEGEEGTTNGGANHGSYTPENVVMWKRVRRISHIQMLNPDKVMELRQESAAIVGTTEQPLQNQEAMETKATTLLAEDREGGEPMDDGEGPSNLSPKHDDEPTTTATTTSSPVAVHRYQTLVLQLPKPVTGSVQIHPDGNGGLACLEDGSLILFGVSRSAFTESVPSSTTTSGSSKEPMNPNCFRVVTKVIYLVKGFKKTMVTCASFANRGQHIYAATKNGMLLGFEIPSSLSNALFRTDAPLSTAVGSVWDASSISNMEQEEESEVVAVGENFNAKIPGGAMTTQLVSSRNGRMILVNSKDSSLRLYGTEDCWNLAENKRKRSTIEIKPRFTFQDAVSKHQWASCDLSGDGEYVVGGCNNKETGDKYELYLWNTATGVLLDQLTGPQVSLHSISWHPTRSFIAVGTSDGLVDIWGPRMDWTAFAPDFQALQKNVEYIEREDEFDNVIDGDEDAEVKRQKLNDELEEQEYVDVVKVDTVPAFDSDSEDEESVFYFDINIRGHSALSRKGKI